MIFFIAGVAEAHRLPFDLPEAESELVAGYHSEYSGFKFAMFFIGEYLGITVISALIVTLFFGGWLACAAALPPRCGLVHPQDLFFICLFILVRAALPRPQVRSAHGVRWKVMLPLALLNLLVTGGIVLALGGSGRKVKRRLRCSR